MDTRTEKEERRRKTEQQKREKEKGEKERSEDGKGGERAKKGGNQRGITMKRQRKRIQEGRRRRTE